MKKTISPLYQYECKIIEVIDGDTVDVEIDLGFNVTVRERIRLAEINAPEIHGDVSPEELEGGNYFKDRLLKYLSVDNIRLSTEKHQEKWGRFIGHFFVPIEIPLSNKGHFYLNEVLRKEIDDWFAQHPKIIRHYIPDKTEIENLNG